MMDNKKLKILVDGDNEVTGVQCQSGATRKKVAAELAAAGIRAGKLGMPRTGDFLYGLIVYEPVGKVRALLGKNYDLVRKTF